MALLEKTLIVKKSGIPGAGQGLYTKKDISRGEKILEYKGKITTWKEVDHQSGSNGYIYYVNRNHVIDAGANKKSLARYANDAKGLTRIDGLKNNCEYIEEGTTVYVVAKRDIHRGEELLVPYGKEYWDVIRYNMKIDERNSQAKKKK